MKEGIRQGRARGLRPGDGRLQRAERTRRAIIEAVLSLIEGGNPRPTASEISRRAGVSLRSVYQHFGDLDDLFFEAALAKLTSLEEREVPAPRTGPLARRLDAFVTQRVRMLEAVTPARQAMLLAEASPRVSALLDQFRARGETQVAEVFARELERIDRGERQEVLVGLCVVTGWTMWSELRFARKLSRAKAQRVMTRAVRCLLK